MTLNLVSLACADAVRQLGNHLWQSTLFAGVVALIALALRKHQARVRYWLWMAASAKFLIPLALLISLGSHLARRPSHSMQSQDGMVAAVDAMSQPFTDVAAFDAPDPPMVSAPTQPAVPRSPMALLPALLGVVWLCGCITVIGYWCVQWRRIAKVVEEAQPLLEGREVEALRRMEAKTRRHRRRIADLVVARDSMEPGLCGIARPVLLWPEGITPHFDDAHLEAILAHEVCHVRRRDNLTSVVHMLVEAIFWFHPLVWWMERRLVEERERACDESVLEVCGRPQVYAESLLKVCEFCVESPLACISGITGADLKRRIGQIMTASIARKLGLGARLALLTAGLVVVCVPILLGQMKGARVLAAVKASEQVAAGAISFAARVASPIEPEPATPPNSLIAPTTVREFQTSGVIELAQAAAPTDSDSLPMPRRRVLGMVLSVDPDGPAHSMMAPGTIVSPAPVYPCRGKGGGDTQGVVELNATVTSAGTVANIADVSGPQVLRQSAIDAVMQWQFKQPDDGKSVAGVTNIKFIYQLPSQLPGMPPVSGPAPPAEEAAAGVKQYGGNVTAPLQIYRVDPEYTDLARTDKVQGTVTVSLVVDEHGVPQHVKVVRGLGDGLDEKAVDAVKQDRFRPGRENDKPVPVFLYYKVDFALKETVTFIPAPIGSGSQNEYGVLKDGKFHHFLTNLELTIPDGYVFNGCGPSSGNGEQAYMSSQSQPGLAVWMRPVAEPLDGLRAGVRAKMVDKPSERDEGWKERPESVRELTFSGKPGISVVADYMLNGKSWVEYLIWINTGKTHTQFYGRAAVDQLAVLQKNVDTLAKTAVIP